ncbi:MAG: hypothetical protein DCC65_05215 [Planctomycetota bacterium]|nr:MAG: hypothetical protein DCC65_05215 [Planctomycetota bacterium]
MTRFLTLLLALLVFAGPVSAQAPLPVAATSADAAVAQALDQKIESLSVSDMAVGDALADIGRQTGLRISADEPSLELLPWGAQTRLAKVTVSHASLREILPQVLAPLGMTYDIRDGGVFVFATDPLKRMNRRANWDDLKLLQRCNETQFSPETFRNFKLQFRITSKVDAANMLEHQLSRSGRGSVAEMLEVATGALGWVWFPNGDAVVIRTQQAQIANRLARRISARYANMPLARVLLDLSEKAETQFVLEPGMMLKLPQSTVQSYSLLLQSASIRQALELICAETGLKYEIEREVVRIGLSDALQEGGKRAAGRSSPYVGKIVVPGADGGYSLEFLIRADELPPDILESRDQMIEEIIQKMRKDISPSTPMSSPDAPDQ